MQASTGGGYGYTLMKAAQVWRTEVGAALRPHGITVPQFFVLMALYRQHRHAWPALTQTAVATAQGMDANTASQIFRVLERNGLVRRTTHPDDARAKALELTALGVERAVAASAAARAINDVFFSVVDERDQRALAATLEILTTGSEHRA